jgi:hypothetical protein
VFFEKPAQALPKLSMCIAVLGKARTSSAKACAGPVAAGALTLLNKAAIACSEPKDNKKTSYLSVILHA